MLNFTKSPYETRAKFSVLWGMLPISTFAETTNREPPSKRKEKLDGQHREPKPHEMGLQVPRRVHTEGSKKSAVRAVAGASWRVFRTLAQHKESRIEEGHLMADHVHMMIAIPPKHAVCNVGLHQREKCDSLGRVYGERKRNFTGQSFWGYFRPWVE